MKLTNTEKTILSRAMLCYREHCESDLERCGSVGGAEYYYQEVSMVDALAARLELPQYTALVDS